MTGPRRYKRIGHHRREANAIYKAQMQAAIARLSYHRYTDAYIAARLGQSIKTIRKYKRQMMAKPPRPIPNAVHPDDLKHYRRTEPRPGKKLGDLVQIPPKEVREYRRLCLDLRKQAMPYDEIASVVGITEQEARRFTAEALSFLQDSETTNTELERRLMVEQIDAMIRAGYKLATKKNGDPNFDAQDRIIKLLDRKAKLLGLDQVPAQDIRVKLQELAAEANYDLRELEDIARHVLARHRFTMIESEPVTAVSEPVSSEPAS